MKSNILQESLQKLGLSPFEAEVYRLLIDLKKPTVSELAEKLLCSRDKVYDALEALSKLNLANKNTKFSREIEVNSPAQVLALLQYQKSQIEKQTDDLTQVLPDLLNVFNSSSRNPIVNIHTGVEGFMGVFNKFIDEAQEEILCYCNPDFFHQIVSTDYLSIWIKRRLAKHLSIRILTTYSEQPFFAIYTSKQEMRQVKVVSGRFPFKATFYIAGDRITTWNPVLPRAVSIQDREITQLYRSMFENIWESIPELNY